MVSIKFLFELLSSEFNVCSICESKRLLIFLYIVAVLAFFNYLRQIPFAYSDYLATAQ